MTDGQLLERFLHQKPSGAFEDLVRRYGPMVFGVCQRVLNNHHDAEEAFQATFLVLAHKAKSLVSRHSLAGWLHEVALRTALNARRARTQRQMREQQVQQMPEVVAPTAGVWSEVVPYLDQELSRLPEKYRVPIILCDLEGKSGPEAAQQVGCPLGTLSSRLTRAREMLRIRLARHGAAVSTGALVIALSQQAASANVPPELVSSTVQMVHIQFTCTGAVAGTVSPQVATLTDGVIKSMIHAQLKKFIVLASVMIAACLGTGGLVYQMHAAEKAEHSIVIRCIDQAGKPIAGANIFQNHVYKRDGIAGPDDIKNKNYTTDQKGKAKVVWSGESVDLRLWASKEKFVTFHAMWAKQFQSDYQIPDEFTFTLQPGTEIGGIVKDEAGVPIQGARLTIVDQTAQGWSTARPGQPGIRPVRDYSLTNEDGVVTDAKGRWQLNNVPRDEDFVWKDGELATESRFRFEIKHPDYAEVNYSDVDENSKGPVIDEKKNRRGGLWTNVVTLKSLRDRSAVFVMKKK